MTKCNGEEVNTTQNTHVVSEIVGSHVGRKRGNGSALESLLSTPVLLNFTVNTVVNGSSYRCVYWNFTDR